MPSLVYITRIRPPSPELAQALESSGFHVKCFGPGEITADECVLVMTSEAVQAGLPVAELAAISGIGTTPAAESQGKTQLHDIQQHLGAEAAIWNCLKAAGLGEPAVRASARISGSHAPTADNLGFIASQAGLRVLAASQKAAASPSLPLTQHGVAASDHNSPAPSVPAHSVVMPVRATEAAAARSPNGGRFREIYTLGAQRYKRFWRPEALAVALLILAIIVLAGRAAMLRSTADVAAAGGSNPSDRAASEPAGLLHPATALRTQPTRDQDVSVESPKLPAEGERHISDDDFVAEDYTTHFDLNGRRASPVRHGTRSRTIPRRIVVD